MTVILALDTGTNACSAAVWVDGVITASRYEEMKRGHAERLVPMVAEISDEAKCPVKAVDLVAVTIGPGAFTGVRVGLAAAQGFALSAGVPCMGLTTLEVIAASISAAYRNVLISIDSKRSDIYFQIFDCQGTPVTKADVAPLEKIGIIAAQHTGENEVMSLAGDAAVVVSEHLAAVGITNEISCVQYPNATVLAELAASRWSSDNPVIKAAPLYLRPPEAVLPHSGGRLRP